ncbi:MAG: tetratricopeptide repeat protein [Bacteroidetes bacterium]|nr:tetratricopeptide repeat protein [Bacteroidota bacterium]
MKFIITTATTFRIKQIFAAVTVMASLQACSMFEPTAKPSQPQVVSKEKALDAFVEGVTAESLGDPAKAIDQFRLSLIYDSTTVRAATTYYNLARLYQSSGQQALALQHAVVSVKLDSVNTDYRALLARLYFENTLYREAAREYEVLVRTSPDQPDFLYRLAMMYQMSRQIGPALKTFEQYIERFGEDFNVRMQQLMILDARNERQQVINILNGMAVEDPDNTAVRRILSREYLKAGQPDSAVQSLLPLLEADPQDVATLLAVSELYYRAGKDSASAVYLNRLFNTSEITDDELIAAGQIFVEAGKSDSTTARFSVFMFGQLEKQRPADWRPLWFMAVHLMGSDSFGEAAERFEKVVKLNPSLVQGWQNLAVAFLQQQKYQEASLWSGKGLEKHPQDFQLNYFRGFADFQLNADSSAIRFLSKASEINPYLPDPMVILASAYERKGLFALSDSLFGKVLVLDPNNATVLNNFAYSLSERGIRLDEAKRMSEASLKAEPENAAFLDTYGWICYQLKDFQTAEYYIKKSIETGDASAVVYEHLGDVYMAMGNRENAVLWWKKAFEKDPSLKGIKDKLAGAGAKQ